MEFMMAQSFDDSAQNVWKTIADFGGIARYCPSVSESVADGVQPGSHRTLTVNGPEGVSFQYQERLEGIDHEDMCPSYSMPDASRFPMRDGYRATMRVAELAENRCLLTWSASVESRTGSVDEVTAFLGGVYQSVFEGLRTLHP